MKTLALVIGNNEYSGDDKPHAPAVVCVLTDNGITKA